MKNLTLSLLINRIKQQKPNKEKLIILLFSVIISVLFVSTITYGATTIGSNINTGGTLNVNGATTVYGATSIGGAITATSTLNVTGLTTLANASTTQLSIAGNLWINGFATTTSSGNIQGQGILTMLGTGTSTFSGGIQSTALNITSATASSTFANGIILSKGCFLMPDGTCVGSGGSGTINSGITGQLSYYAGSGTTLTATSSLFIHSNQNIGIGTTTPNWLLQVAGVRPFFTLSDTGAGTDNKHWFLSSQGGNFYVGTSSDAYATTSISALTITNGGNIGIATSSPQSALLSVENTRTGYTFYATDSANDTTPFVIDASGNVGVGTIPGAPLDVDGGSARFFGGGNSRLDIYGDNNGSELQMATNHPLRFRNTNTGNLLVDFTASGNVGIGTTSPYTKLSVVGETVSTYFTATSTTATSTFLGAVGVGTSTPVEQLSISGRLFVGGTGTSTIQNNLYVMGTLRSTVSYVGDLVFSNNFRFIETNQNEKIQSLFLNNQYGENIFKIDENGKVVVKEIQVKIFEAEKGKFRNNLQTENLQIGSPQNRTGITIYDEKTGRPYCLKINDGKVLNNEGECK